MGKDPYESWPTGCRTNGQRELQPAAPPPSGNRPHGRLSGFGGPFTRLATRTRALRRKAQPSLTPEERPNIDRATTVVTSENVTMLPSQPCHPRPTPTFSPRSARRRVNLLDELRARLDQRAERPSPSWMCARRTSTAPASSRARSASRAASWRCRPSRSCPTNRPRSSSTARAARAPRSPRRRSPELGYTNVISANPGFVRWKDMGYPVEMPPNSHAGAARSLLAAPAPARGRRGEARRSCSKGKRAPARRRRPRRPGGALPGRRGRRHASASSTPTPSTRRTCSVRSSTRPSRVGMPKVDSAEKAHPRPQPRREGREVPGARRTAATSTASSSRLGHHRRRLRQLPDALPRERRLGLPQKMPVVHGSIFRFEGQVTTFMPCEGPCYRCLYPEPPPAAPGAVAAPEAGVLGILPGIIGIIQATEAVKLILGQGRPAHRPPAHLRLAEDEVPHAQAAPRQELPRVRREPDDQELHRLASSSARRRVALIGEPLSACKRPCCQTARLLCI